MSLPNGRSVTFGRDTFHREAIQTPSHDDVTEMRALLVDTLEAEGHAPTVDEAGTVRVTRNRSGSDDPRVVLNTHLDTVSPHVHHDRDGDIVYGRGTCDARGSLAALVDTSLTASVDTGRLTLAVTVDEETAQFGGAHLGETLPADGYIVGEPTGLDVCHAARGNFGGRSRCLARAPTPATYPGEGSHSVSPGRVSRRRTHHPRAQRRPRGHGHQGVM